MLKFKKIAQKTRFCKALFFAMHEVLNYQQTEREKEKKQRNTNEEIQA